MHPMRLIIHLVQELTRQYVYPYRSILLRLYQAEHVRGNLVQGQNFVGGI